MKQQRKKNTFKVAVDTCLITKGVKDTPFFSFESYLMGIFMDPKLAKAYAKISQVLGNFYFFITLDRFSFT